MDNAGCIIVWVNNINFNIMEEKLEYFIFYDDETKIYTIGYFSENFEWTPIKDFNNLNDTDKYLKKIIRKIETTFKK